MDSGKATPVSIIEYIFKMDHSSHEMFGICFAAVSSSVQARSNKSSTAERSQIDSPEDTVARTLR